MRARAARAILGARSILITSHVRPDGDSVGSSLALWRVLRKSGRKASLLAQDPIPRRFSFLPGAKAWRTARGGTRRRAELTVALCLRHPESAQCLHDGGVGLAGVDGGHGVSSTVSRRVSTIA